MARSWSALVSSLKFLFDVYHVFGIIVMSENSSPTKPLGTGNHLFFPQLGKQTHIHSDIYKFHLTLTFCSHAAPFQHTPSSMFHSQHYVIIVVLARSTPDMLDPILFKVIYLVSSDQKNIFIMLLLMLFGKVKYFSVVQFFQQWFSSCRGCLHAVFFTLSDQPLKHQFPQMILMTSQKHLSVFQFKFA